MNKIDGKTSKRVEDIEILLYTIRKFALAKTPLPGHLQQILSKTLGDDPDLTAYYHLRSLRYPSIKSMLIRHSAYHSDNDTSDDDDISTMPKNGKRKTSIEIERMYR